MHKFVLNLPGRREVNNSGFSFEPSSHQEPGQESNSILRLTPACVGARTSAKPGDLEALVFPIGRRQLEQLFTVAKQGRCRH